MSYLSRLVNLTNIQFNSQEDNKAILKLPNSVDQMTIDVDEPISELPEIMIISTDSPSLNNGEESLDDFNVTRNDLQSNERELGENFEEKQQLIDISNTKWLPSDNRYSSKDFEVQKQEKSFPETSIEHPNENHVKDVLHFDSKESPLYDKSVRKKSKISNQENENSFFKETSVFDAYNKHTREFKTEKLHFKVKESEFFTLVKNTEEFPRSEPLVEEMKQISKDKRRNIIDNKNIDHFQSGITMNRLLKWFSDDEEDISLGNSPSEHKIKSFENINPIDDTEKVASKMMRPNDDFRRGTQRKTPDLSLKIGTITLSVEKGNSSKKSLIHEFNSRKNRERTPMKSFSRLQRAYIDK